jgi:hypothetical protein
VPDEGEETRQTGTLGRAYVTPSGAVIWICTLCKPNDFFGSSQPFEDHLKVEHNADIASIDGPTGNTRS